MPALLLPPLAFGFRFAGGSVESHLQAPPVKKSSAIAYNEVGTLRARFEGIRSTSEWLPADEFEAAGEVFDKMPTRTESGPTITSLIKWLCFVGRIEEAKALMRNLTESTAKPDIHAYTAMMNGLCKLGRTIEALELLDEALETGLSPTAATYNALFTGFSRQGRPLSGFRLLNRMELENCKPDRIIYSTMIHGLLKWGKIQPALTIYRKMVENGFRLDDRLMNALLRGLCRRSRQENEALQDAYALYAEMKLGNHTIYPCAYSLVVEALCRGGKIDGVFQILIEMIEIGHSPKTSTFNVAIHGLCCGGEVDKALQVVMLMHGARKACGIPFSALISELDLRGRSLDACAVYGMAIKRGVGVVPQKRPRKM